MAPLAPKPDAAYLQRKREELELAAKPKHPPEPNDGVRHAVYGLPSEQIKCSCHAVSCILQQWAREVVYISMGLFQPCCGPPRRDPILKSGALASKRVLFIRHGQGMHNTSMMGWELIDPPLTRKGEGQAQTLHEQLLAEPDFSSVELVITSPLTRAMQTALGGFDGVKVPFMVSPILRERLGAPCDVGLPPSKLTERIPEISGWTGFDKLDQEWWCTDPIELDLLERVEKFKDFVSARPEKVIAVVGHGGFFSRILGFHLKNCGYSWVDWEEVKSTSTTV